MAVIILKNGDKIETKEDYMAVTKQYSEASWADATELMYWMRSAEGGPFPNPKNPFTITDRKTGKEISLCPEQMKTIVKEDNEQLTGNEKSTIVTLTSGKEIVVSEDFDMVYSIWEHEPAVILLTEKNTRNRLAISTKSIAMLG